MRTPAISHTVSPTNATDTTAREYNACVAPKKISSAANTAAVLNTIQMPPSVAGLWTKRSTSNVTGTHAPIHHHSVSSEMRWTSASP